MENNIAVSLLLLERKFNYCIVLYNILNHDFSNHHNSSSFIFLHLAYKLQQI
jgi:hypothetical protein